MRVCMNPSLGCLVSPRQMHARMFLARVPMRQFCAAPRLDPMRAEILARREAKKQHKRDRRALEELRPELRRPETLGAVKRYRLSVAYLGTNFHGWQKQTLTHSKLRTVQQELEGHARQFLKQAVRIVGASRTDSGVSALEQVVGFDAVTTLTPAEIMYGLNSVLPPDIRVRSAGTEAPSWSPVLSTWKRYVYTMDMSPESEAALTDMLGSYSTEDGSKPSGWTPTLDLSLMRRAAALLEGKHDFCAFAQQQPESSERELFRCSVYRYENNVLMPCSVPETRKPPTSVVCHDFSQPRRKTGTKNCEAVSHTIAIQPSWFEVVSYKKPDHTQTSWFETFSKPPSKQQQSVADNLSNPSAPSIFQESVIPPNRLVICFEGDGFLYKMCRIIAGTLTEVGCGLRTVESIPSLFEQKNRKMTGPTLPGDGLCLDSMRFDPKKK